MVVNYHTHTFRCNHASGTDRDYVISAIENGIKVLGFSDHNPYLFDNGYYSKHRMKVEETDNYIRSISELREEFKNDIDIYIGYEMEYYPLWFGKTIDFLKNKGFDYIIFGQHLVGNEIGCRASVTLSDSKEELVEYVDIIVKAMNSGYAFYIAHPDILNFSGDEDFYRQEISRLCLEAKRLNIPLEINLLGIREGRFYPVDRFWKIAGEIGNKVILGSDAHSPSVFANKDDEIKAQKLAEKYNLEIVEPMKPQLII